MGDVGDVLEPVKKGKVTAWDENHQYHQYHCLSYIVIAKNILKPHKQRLVPVCQWSSTLDCPSYKYSCPNIYHCAWSLPWSWGSTPRSVWSLLRRHLSQFSSGSNHPAPKSAAKMLQQEEIQHFTPDLKENVWIGCVIDESHQTKDNSIITLMH